MQQLSDDIGPYAFWEYHKAQVLAATGVEPAQPPTISDWMSGATDAAEDRIEKGEDDGSITDQNNR